jgi:hypothetical protein
MTGVEEHGYQQIIAKIAHGLRRWCRGEADRRLTIRLTAVAVEIAMQSSLRGRICAAAAAEDANPPHVALSLLAGLFVRHGSEPYLAVALRDVIDDDDAAVYSMFRRVVWTVVRQELFHRWPENDRLSAGLWKKLHLVIRDDPRITAFPAHRPAWITTATTDTSIDLIILDEVELRRIIAEVFRPRQKTADLVMAVFAHPACRNRVVSIDSLFVELQACIPQGLAFAMEEEISSPAPDPDFVLAMEKTVSEVRSSMLRILDAYVVKDKLSAGMAAGFLKALMDLVVDLGDGWPGIGHFNYIHTHCPAITYDNFCHTYKAIFQYLALKAERWFSDGMRKYYYGK